MTEDERRSQGGGTGTNQLGLGAAAGSVFFGGRN